LSRLIGDPWCLGLAYQNLIALYMWRENGERAKLLLEEYVMLNLRKSCGAYSYHCYFANPARRGSVCGCVGVGAGAATGAEDCLCTTNN
jgi:hypothetical protein